MSLSSISPARRRCERSKMPDFPKRKNKMNKKKLIQAQREKILSISRKYGVKSIKIFGSVARGEENSLSDLDFLVNLEAGRSLFDLGGLQIDLEESLNCNVDVVTEKGLRDRIRDDVIREAVSL